MKRLGAIAAAALLAALTPSAARAQTTTTSLPPLEDVTLRGRVLGADGSAVANTPLRVDAINDSGFAIVGFFFSAGLSTLACFTGPNEVCPIPNSKRFSSATDSAGNYSFTFHHAHRRGIQTDTDYVLSIGVPSRAGADTLAVASYELELQDPVHSAPDLTMWDPTVRVTPAARAFRVSYDRRPSSKNGVQVLINGKPSGVAVSDAGDIDARAVEDQPFSVVAHASKDETAAGTIYHQRFTAAAVGGKGTLVPLSRGAACTATRVDGSEAHCGYTDGDLVTPGVVDPPDAQAVPVTKVTIDLGAARKVADIRTRCGCTLEASQDAQSWFNLPPSGSFGAQQMRYVRVSGASLGAIPEISVWPPWPESPGSNPLLPDAPGRKTWSWLIAFAAAVALGIGIGRRGRRHRDDIAEVSGPL